MKSTTRRFLVLAAAALALLLQSAVSSAQTGVLFVANDKVGVGQENPQQPLHVYANDGTARLLVQEGSSATGQRILLVLQNQGPGATKMRMTSGGSETWDFQTQSSGFAFSRNGTGGSEVFVGNDGSVRMGPGGASSFDLAANGNLTIAGTLTESSSRAFKTGIELVNGEEILAALLQMPVSLWSYQHDASPARHIGPMAEDFYAAFGLGVDSAHISPGDKAGVALAAIKGLSSVIDAKDREIAVLKSRLDALEQLVNDLAVQ